MDVLKLSKFKLQLRAVISEVHQLKERESSANKQLQLTIQKQKQAEEEFGRKVNELQPELDSAFEIRHKLERRISCLETENEMLDNQQKGLKETISNLLQSKESFVKAYEDSFGEMRQVIEAKDRRIEYLSKMVKTHLLLVEAIEKEASSIKDVVKNTDSVLKEREKVVAGLKSRADVVSNLELLFVDKVNNLESKLRNAEDELTRKDKVIFNLEARLDAERFSENLQPRVDQLQKDLSAKEIVIQNLICEKKALLFEVANSDFVMKKIQHAVSLMDEQNRKAMSLIMEGQEKGVATMDHEAEINSFNDVQKPEEAHVTSCGENALGAPVTEEDQNASSTENAEYHGFSIVESMTEKAAEERD